MAKTVSELAREIIRRLDQGEPLESAIGLVLTGEGADEMLGGYDIFKEAKVRRFWAAVPESRWRPLLLQRPRLPGKNTWISVPLPGSLEAVVKPLCFLTMPATTANPKPVPPYLRLSCSSCCLKASNITF